MFHTWKGSGCGSPDPWAFILPSWTDRILWCSLRVFQIRYEELQPRKECDSNWCNKYSPQCHYSSCGWMSLRDALCTKPDLKGSQWLKYWWILMLSSYSKSKTSDKVMRCRAGKAYLHSLSASQTCSLRRELVCVFRGGTGQGARQSQALTKSSLTRFNLRAVTGTLPSVTSASQDCWGHNLQGKASPCATRQSTEEQDISTWGGTKMGLMLLTAQSSPPQWKKPGKVGRRKKNPTAHPAEGSGYQQDLHAMFQCTSDI